MESPSPLRWSVTIARVLIGIGALALGVKHLLDPDFLIGGLYYRLAQLGSPYEFYGRILGRLEYRQEFLAYVICVSEILFGLSYLTGALVSLASVGAAFLVMNLAMAVSAGSILSLLLYILIAVIFLAMGFVGAGLHLGVDGWLVERIDERFVLLPLRLNLPEW